MGQTRLRVGRVAQPGEEPTKPPGTGSMAEARLEGMAATVSALAAQPREAAAAVVELCQMQRTKTVEVPFMVRLAARLAVVRRRPITPPPQRARAARPKIMEPVAVELLVH